MSTEPNSETNHESSSDRSGFKSAAEMVEYLERILPPRRYAPAKKTVGSLSYEELLHMMGSRGSKAA
ncbi:MAG TPA: hypothetical protein VKA70_05200 [Blastocatellia bacterium]|nr:hypothetical protein [Blastocatellia bacterium]